MRVGAAFLFWREPVLPAEGQRGVDAADAVPGTGVENMARAVAQQNKRQVVRLHIGAARRRLAESAVNQTSARARVASAACSFSF